MDDTSQATYVSARSLAGASPDGTLLRLLERGALTPWQVEWLAEHWDNLPQDWHRDPYFHTVREHTVAFIGHGGRRLAQTPNEEVGYV